MPKKSQPEAEIVVKPKNKGGRPKLYSPELTQKVCDLISIEPMSLQKICAKHNDIPSYQTINEWIRDHQAFSDLYYEAKSKQADSLADDTWDKVLDVAEDKDAIAKVALLLKFAQWQNARLAPKRWRESTNTNVTATVKHEDKLKELV